MSRSSDSTKPAEWRARFERFSQAGLAVAPFCGREGVSTASFYNWRKKLRLNGRSRSATQRHAGLRTDPAEERGRFQQVAVVPTASGMTSTARAVSIQLPCGTHIEVAAEDLDALRTVVAEVVRADRSRGTGAA